VKIYTIGFTQKTAEEFFTILQRAGVLRLIDVRLKGQSQLAGFAKQSDLPYFLRAIGGIEYHHEPLLVATDELLTAFRHKKMGWDEYETTYVALLKKRKVEKGLDQRLFTPASVLLCSESTPEHCHRRLAAEYLAGHWPNVSIVHL
jgi:uncharacterized protein (DUF488 family)